MRQLKRVEEITLFHFSLILKHTMLSLSLLPEVSIKKNEKLQLDKVTITQLACENFLKLFFSNNLLRSRVKYQVHRTRRHTFRLQLCLAPMVNTDSGTSFPQCFSDVQHSEILLPSLLKVHQVRLKRKHFKNIS